MGGDAAGSMKQAKINRKLARRFLRQQVFDTYRVDNIIYYNDKLNRKKREAEAYDHILPIVEAD